MNLGFILSNPSAIVSKTYIPTKLVVTFFHPLKYDALFLFCLNMYQNSVSDIKVIQGFLGKVSPSSYLGRTEGLAGNSKHTYEVCDSKSEKSSPPYRFEGKL